MNQLLCLVWLFEEELDNGRHKLQLNLGVLVLSNSVGLVTASLLLFSQPFSGVITTIFRKLKQIIVEILSKRKMVTGFETKIAECLRKYFARFGHLSNIHT